MSRQRDYQIKMLAEGRCTTCGKTPIIKMGLCALHLAKNRMYKREQYRRSRSSPVRKYTRSTPDVEAVV